MIVLVCIVKQSSLYNDFTGLIMSFKRKSTPSYSIRHQRRVVQKETRHELLEIQNFNDIHQDDHSPSPIPGPSTSDDQEIGIYQ